MDRRTALVGAVVVALLSTSCGATDGSDGAGEAPPAATDGPLTLRLTPTGGAAGGLLAEDLQR